MGWAGIMSPTVLTATSPGKKAEGGAPDTKGLKDQFGPKGKAFCWDLCL